MNFFPTQAINELASEFKLLRKDIQAIRNSLSRIEQKLVGSTPTQSSPNPKPSLNLFQKN